MMNTDKEGYIVTSVIYRVFQKRPERKLDNGIQIHTHVYARNEEEAKMIAEDKVQEDFVVDEYRFRCVHKSEEWMREIVNENCDMVRP